MNYLLAIMVVLTHIAGFAKSENPLKRLQQIAKQTDNPKEALKDLGPLLIAGNSSLEDAQIVLMPEVHDDPKSQMVQLFLMALEKTKKKPFIILDESLVSLEKSSWEIFSQKTMEILAAEESRANKERYSPHSFEAKLQNIASKFRKNTEQLNFEKNSRLWIFEPYQNKATPFFGWDLAVRNSLVERNVEMVNTLKKTIPRYDRILLMLGARHVPELEYYTSKQLLCSEDQPDSVEEYFRALRKKYGEKPDLQFGVGATLPIYQFLKDKKYVVVFSKQFYPVLHEIVQEFKNSYGGQQCMNL